MGRILIGLLKGGVVGGAIGYFASRAGIAGGLVAMLVYGVVGAAVGLVCGKPVWRQDTLWTPLLKAVFGVGVGIGVTFLARKFLSGVHIPIAAIPGAMEHSVPEVPALLAAGIGVLYGAFVELDDAGGGDASKKPKPRR
ncbi:MAG TPA: hypothetical protein VGP07_06185 [Polyangia bacterium]|jgi:hypothetical protein